MKKMISACAGVALLAAGLTAPISAQSDNAAAVITDGGCTGFVPTADGGFGSLIFTPDGAQAVQTSSGVQILTCQFEIPEGQEPSRATIGSGFGCFTFFGFTNDTKMYASPGGRATLVCKVAPAE